MPTTDKSKLRQTGLRARRALSPTERENFSLAICSQLVSAPGFQRAVRVGCYLPLADEVSPWPLIERAWRMKKRVFVPVVEKKHRMRFRHLNPGAKLSRGSLGIFEPTDGKLIDATALDIVFVPLVAFDRKGWRIGMGGGYYDRAFASQRNRRQWFRPRLIGLAYSCQEVPAVCASHWDIPLFRVCTETGWVTVASQ